LAAFGSGATLHLRNPAATRPWQHVLDPLHGYLQLAERLCQPGQGQAWAEGWNFGPPADDALAVEAVVRLLAQHWPQPVRWTADPPGTHAHEAGQLRLDCSKARQRLGWRPTWDTRTALRQTVQWHLATQPAGGTPALEACRAQLAAFLQDAQRPGNS